MISIWLSRISVWPNWEVLATCSASGGRLSLVSISAVCPSGGRKYSRKCVKNKIKQTTPVIIEVTANGLLYSERLCFRCRRQVLSGGP